MLPAGEVAAGPLDRELGQHHEAGLGVHVVGRGERQDEEALADGEVRDLAVDRERADSEKLPLLAGLPAGPSAVAVANVSFADASSGLGNTSSSMPPVAPDSPA